MRVLPAVQNGVAASGPARRSEAGSGFTLDETRQARPGAASRASAPVQSVEALLALQGVDGVDERRRRFTGRGRVALDLLDTLKVEILEGRPGLETLRRLEVVLEGLAERSGEPGLDNVLDAIGVRVAVELAKRKPATRTAA